MRFQNPLIRFVTCLGALCALVLLIGLTGGCGGGGEDTSATKMVKPPPLTRPAPEVLAQVQTKLQLAYRAVQEGDQQTAGTYFEDVAALVPEFPMTYYHLAFHRATNDDAEGALEQLKKAADKGYCDPEPLMMLHHFAEVVKLPDWPKLRDRMLENRKPFWGPDIASYQEFDPTLEPDFGTLDSLKAAFDIQINEVRTLVFLHPETKVRLHVWNVLNHRIAALRKLAQNDLTEPEQLLIDREILGSVAGYEESNRSPWLVSTVKAVTRVTDDFIARYGDKKEEAAQAAYIQARAKWYGKRPQSSQDQTDEQVEFASKIYTAVYDAYPGTISSLMAMMDAMTIVSDHKGFAAPELVGYSALVDSVYGNNEMMAKGQIGVIFSSMKSAIEFSNKGIPDMTLTDLDGNQWRTSDLGGKVTLIDFWATWCSPCRKELPNLVRLYSEYKDQGFEILGVSLDYAKNYDNDKLREWMKENNMTWPTVFDGKDWSGEAARTFGVTSIPFPILIGADGKVIAAGQMAKGVSLRNQLAKALK